MDVHPARQVVAGASAGRDADHLACGRGRDLPELFRARGHDFLWALGGGAAADAVLLVRRAVLPVVACQAAEAEFAEADFPQDARRAAGPELGVSKVAAA
jgi:hypothetical protein